MDRSEHAFNTIEAMKQEAVKALASIQKREDSEVIGAENVGDEK